MKQRKVNPEVKATREEVEATCALLRAEGVIVAYGETYHLSLDLLLSRFQISWRKFQDLLTAHPMMEEAMEAAKASRKALKDEVHRHAAESALLRALNTTETKRKLTRKRSTPQGETVVEEVEETKDRVPPPGLILGAMAAYDERFRRTPEGAAEDGPATFNLFDDEDTTTPQAREGATPQHRAETFSAHDAPHPTGAPLGDEDAPPMGQDHLSAGLDDGRAV